MSQFEAGNALNRIEMSQNLRGSLQRAISYAYDQFHRQVTLEHLLLALIEDREAAVILEASAVQVSSLLTEVSDYLGRLEDRALSEHRQQPALGADIQHIIQSAGAAAQKSRRSAVSSALVLAAIVGDGRSPSAQMLRNHGMTFESAIAALKQANAAEAAKPVEPPAATAPAPQPSGPAKSSPQPAAPTRATALPPAAGVEGNRLQNMQAAHEIIANARERIATARGAVANHTEAANVPPARPAPASPEPAPAATPSPPAEAPPPDEVVPKAAETPVREIQEKAPPPQQNAPAPSPPQRNDDGASPERPPAREAAQPAPEQPVQQQTAPIQPAPVPPPPAAPSPQPAMAPPEPTQPARPQAVNPGAAQPLPHQPLPPQPMAPQPAGPQVAAPLPRPPQPASAPAFPQPSPAHPPSSPNGGSPHAPPNQVRPQPFPQDDVPPTGGRPITGQPGAPPVANNFDPVPPSEPRAPRVRSADLATVVRPIDPEKLAELLPTKMRMGVPTTIEVRAPRARLEAWSGGNADPYERDGQIITKAMVMRLKAPEGGFTVEVASPETQWSEGFAGPLSDDVVSWRWIVTPQQRGRLPLLLSVSTRVVGRDGLAAARALPEQLVTVKVAPNYARLAGRLSFWILLAVTGAAVGYFGDHLFSIGSSMLAQVIN